MIAVQDLPRIPEVEVVGRLLVPRQLDQPLQIAPDHPVLRCSGWQLLEPGELTIRLLAGLFRQLRLFDLLAEFPRLHLLLVALSQLVLDRLQLLAQEELTLPLADLRFHVGLDLRADLDHLEFSGEQLRQSVQTLGDVALLE